MWIRMTVQFGCAHQTIPISNNLNDDNIMLPTNNHFIVNPHHNFSPSSSCQSSVSSSAIWPQRLTKYWVDRCENHDNSSIFHKHTYRQEKGDDRSSASVQWQFVNTSSLGIWLLWTLYSQDYMAKNLTAAVFSLSLFRHSNPELVPRTPTSITSANPDHVRMPPPTDPPSR